MLSVSGLATRKTHLAQETACWVAHTWAWQLCSEEHSTHKWNVHIVFRSAVCRLWILKEHSKMESWNCWYCISDDVILPISIVIKVKLIFNFRTSFANLLPLLNEGLYGILDGPSLFVFYWPHSDECLPTIDSKSVTFLRLLIELTQRTVLQLSDDEVNICNVEV